MSVKVNYGDLEQLVTQLRSIVGEFEQAGSRRRALEDAVARPYGENALHDAADDFEGRWDDRRKNLMENCKGLADHVDDVLVAFKDWDSEAAAKFDEGEGQ